MLLETSLQTACTPSILADVRFMMSSSLADQAVLGNALRSHVQVTRGETILRVLSVAQVRTTQPYSAALSPEPFNDLSTAMHFSILVLSIFPTAIRHTHILNDCTTTSWRACCFGRRKTCGMRLQRRSMAGCLRGLSAAPTPFSPPTTVGMY